MAIAWRHSCRIGLIAGIAQSLFYMAAAAILTSRHVGRALGALVKTGPAIVLMLTCLALLEDRGMTANRIDTAWPDDRIILYDGLCVLCSGWMRFVLTRDRDRLFRFTPIQSPYGRALALALEINPDDPDTNAVVMHGAAWRRSDAALQVVSALPGLGWVCALRFVPRPVRDNVYRRIARNRYRLFGRHTVCDLGDGGFADRVVTELPPEH